jgi:hypothetical protein
MHRFARIITTALAVVVVGATIASATPGLFAAKDKKDDLTPSPTLTPTPSETPSPTETPSPEPTETPSPEPSDTSDGDGWGTAPDFSACVGLTGLENAICRHEALLEVHPDNHGLQNSLTHLQANLAKHQAAEHGPSGEHGSAATHGPSGSHAHSGEPHGKSGEPHGH